MFLIIFLAIPQLVFAGPKGYVSLTNGTPYDWVLTYSHSYQLRWDPLPTITSGTSYQHYVEYLKQFGDNGDCGGEATYSLLGAPVEMSFTLQAKQKNGKRLQIQYHNSLASLGHNSSSLIDLGFKEDDIVAFILSGTTPDNLISSKPPIAWMQTTLSSINQKSLRELAMPYSHNAGMGIMKMDGWWLFPTPKVLKQPWNIYVQLSLGSRWFGIRPVIHGGVVHTSHDMIDANSSPIDRIVSDINKFTAEFPGELIVLDVSDEFSKAPDVMWLQLYGVLDDIKDLWMTTESSLPYDLTTVPLWNFITPGSKCAVLIRIPDSAPLPPASIGPAFLKASRLPYTGSYSETDQVFHLSSDQINQLSEFRTSPNAQMHRSTFTLLQHTSAQTLEDRPATHQLLYSALWPAMTRSSYPNLIEIDNVKACDVAPFCMAINSYFAGGMDPQTPSKRA